MGDTSSKRQGVLTRQKLGVYAIYSLSFFTLFLFWHIMATYVTPSVLFSPPLAVFVKAFELALSGVLFEHIAISMQRIVIGFLLGSALGFPIGLMMGNFQFVKHFLEPYTEFFRFIPAIALITVAVIWFGIGETSKVFLIIYSTIFIVILNTMAGVMSIPVNKVRAAQCLGANRMQVFLHVSLPATLPYILTGMRLAMANSFATIVSAEMLGANAGVGTMLWTARLFMLIDELFVGLLTLGLLGFATDRVFRYLIIRFGGKYSVVA
jgi:ABC-type nitrate/sulfonate/bicarbonate transport system permease component